MNADILQIILTTVVTGVVGGAVTAIAVIPVLRKELEHLRQDVDRHEQWIHSMAGKLSGPIVVDSSRRRATSR